MTGTIKLIALCLLLSAAPMLAQTKKPPKKVSKSATQKPVVKKKPVAKKGLVFICDGTGGYTFHSRKTCAELAKCKGRVLDMTKADAMNNWGRKQCKNCY